MMAWCNLIWIVPLSMVIGAFIIICIACVIVGKESEEKLENLRKIEEEELKEG